MRALLLLIALSGTAFAGPWTRDAGHFYVETSWSGIFASHYYAPDFKVVPIVPYAQNVVSYYAEVGLVSRWLTATVDGTLYRRNAIEDMGYTEGFGDMRVGLWTGLVTRPVRLSIGATLGIPTGDPTPHAGRGADAEAELIARSLPTGDGEWDLDTRASLGYSFGGIRAWPLQHYLIVEAGYWARTNGFSDAFVYRVQLGVKFPWRVVERFWLAFRWVGVESFASNAEAAKNATGLGNGVTYEAPGVDLYARVWKGLGLSFSVDGAVRARSVAAAAQYKVALSVQW